MSARYLSTKAYAEQVLGGIRSAKSVARWCKAGKFGEKARQLPDGTWVIEADAPPPAMAAEVGEEEDVDAAPNPGGRDGAISLSELARRVSASR